MTALDTLPVHVRNKLESTLDWFDAEKAARVYEFLKWVWVSAEVNPDGIPCAAEIRAQLRDLAAEAYQSAEPGSEARVAAGGLCVTCFKEGDGADFSFDFVAVSA
jgi:hypothetical protein